MQIYSRFNWRPPLFFNVFFVALFNPQFLELHPGQRLKDQKSTLAEERGRKKIHQR
jgi:hypothetical protein